jgi:glycosyltransferase involved in cell wall biosynthesis
MSTNVTIIFRDKRPGNHSIERLFNAILPAIAEEFDCKSITIPSPPGNLFGIMRNIFYARSHSRGVNHVTGDAQYLAIFLGNNTVLTIHDCGSIPHYRGIKRFLYKLFWYRLPILCSKYITVISEATREAVEREFGKLGRKLVVIHNCLPAPVPRISRQFNRVEPRILQIGTGPHKNLRNLIFAVTGLNCVLHIVGKLTDELISEMESREIRYENEFDISDTRLIKIYQQTDILFFASRHEGFGLPILEAQSAGVPVVTSNLLSMPEVAGKGALLVDPESPSQIREALVRLIEDETLRSELIANGLENIRRFDVRAVASQYLSIYRKCGAISRV